MNWILYIHLIAAMAWIGGSIFLFVLGITLRDKEQQHAIYPVIGPIFGYFEIVALIILLLSGTWLAYDSGLLNALAIGDHSKIVDLLRIKLWFVLLIIIASLLHFYIALKTNTKARSLLENLISRGSSLLIFFLNLVVVYYAILIRGIIH
ncbi:hypothetical protein [Sulfurospirillum sp. 1612]|uniref:hypothetical protein n=1 Tax=Sulfurospirillum sp. 1612 TaxID=3094835 RepID=UPI002F91EC5D